MADTPKTNVLFCCLGNICRSTMAEGAFRSIAKSNPRVGEIDSCGTGAYHILNPPDSRTMSTLRKNGITDYEHAARQITTDDFTKFDYIFAMDEWNLRDLEKLKRRIESKGTKTKAQVMLFGEFGGSGNAEEVEDPYYGANNGFSTVFEQVTRFSKNFLADVVDKEAK